MKSKQTTSGSCNTTPKRQRVNRLRGCLVFTRLRCGPVLQQAFAVSLSLVCCLAFSGCENAPAKADSGETKDLTEVASSSELQDTPSVELQEAEEPKRLERGEMPDEWKEPQRERVVPIDTSGGSLDLTFDDLKFDIEVGEPFERSLLSEEVKALDRKEITLGGYMKPSFKASGLTGFVFVRDNKECCFGPQAAIYDCVMVRLAKGTKTNYLVRPFKIRGTLYLKEYEGPDGTTWAIFNMKNAKIE